ncbi:hypothetical protein KHA80_20220 [Anaerobacillus sp. HL2]|nr:hypothetical protein KHA80_20220 [Anaerobacillus sp. HL2]
MYSIIKQKKETFHIKPKYSKSLSADFSRRSKLTILDIIVNYITMTGFKPLDIVHQENGGFFQKTAHWQF